MYVKKILVWKHKYEAKEVLSIVIQIEGPFMQKALYSSLFKSHAKYFIAFFYDFNWLPSLSMFA